MANLYMITYIENGEEKTIDTSETEETLKERIKCYRQHNIKIKKVIKKVITIDYVEVKF